VVVSFSSFSPFSFHVLNASLHAMFLLVSIFLGALSPVEALAFSSCLLAGTARDGGRFHHFLIVTRFLSLPFLRVRPYYSGNPLFRIFFSFLWFPIPALGVQLLAYINIRSFLSLACPPLLFFFFFSPFCLHDERHAAGLDG